MTLEYEGIRALVGDIEGIELRTRSDPNQKIDSRNGKKNLANCVSDVWRVILYSLRILYRIYCWISFSLIKLEPALVSRMKTKRFVDRTVRPGYAFNFGTPFYQY